MVDLLSFVNLTAFVIYLFLIIFLLAKNPSSALNRLCAAFLGCFALWCFGKIFTHRVDVTLSATRFFMNILVLGAWSFGGFFVWFACVFTEKTRVVKSWAFYMYVLGIPLVIVSQQWLFGSVVEYVRRPYGWGISWQDTGLPALMIAHVLGSMVIGLVLIVVFRLRTTSSLKRKTATIILISAGLPLIPGTLTNVILPELDVAAVPDLVHVFALAFAVGLVYAIVRHRFLTVSPATAAENILSTMSDGLLLLDPRGMIIAANEALLELLGRPGQDLRGKHASFVLEPARFNPELLTSLLAGDRLRNLDISLPGADQRAAAVSLSTSVLLDEENETAGIVCIVTDISERKAAEELLRVAHDDLELRVEERTAELARANIDLTEEIEIRVKTERKLSEESQRLAVTLRSIGDGVITTDMEGRVTSINAVGEELTGWSGTKGQSQPLEQVFKIVEERTEAPCASPVAQVIERGDMVAGGAPVKLLTQNGGERIVANTAAPISDFDGTIVGAVLVFRDITVTRRMEDEIAKEERLRSLGILAGGIAHDFNNLLTAILGNLAYARGDRSSSELDTLLAEAESATKRAQRLTKQLLTFSKGGAPIKRLSSLSQLLEETVGFVLSGSQSTWDLSLTDDLWPVEIDPGQISQVVQNLVLNASQAMPHGGTIQVAAANVAIGDDSSLPLAPGNYVEISVNDEGTGIDSEDLSQIFDPYFTRKESGSGLGLAVAYAVIERHGGHIGVTSAIGQGSTFTFYLPASDQKWAPKPTEERLAAVTGRGRVLVMDDEKPILRLATRVLTEYGYEVEVASDGATTLAAYGRAMKAGRGFDVVLLDITVPGGLGGKETMERLLELDPAVRGIASSGYSEADVMSNYEDYGFRGMIAKPYTPSKLVEEVARVVEAD